MCYAAVCGASCGQKHSLPFAENGFPAWTWSVFRASNCVHCNSEEGVKQVFFPPSMPQKLGGCKQRGKKRFFTRFPLISCRFRSIPLAFRHSLKALFPCAPHCTVAEDVVKTLPGPCRLKTQAKTRKRFCLDCPHCNFAGKMKHSFLCRTRLRNWGAVNKKGDLK